MSVWVAVAGVAAVAAWMAVAPPWRDGPRGLLRAGAATLLLLALFDVRCRLPDEGGRPRLAVVIDRSLSMRIEGATGVSRLAAGEAWLDGPAFEGWTRGWDVEFDSFGGSTSDLGTAVERAAEVLPDAMLVVTDGRVSGGRSIERADAPLFALVPEPAVLPDAAVLDLALSGGEAEEEAVVEVAAVGGTPVPPGRVEVSVDGRLVERRALPALEVGERRMVRVPIPRGSGGYSTVTARVTARGDRVPENDIRSLIREPAGPRHALAVALGPTWDFATWVRALERSHAGPVEAYWSFPGGGLRPVDGGRPASWTSLDPGPYAAAYLLGDPAALGQVGRAWVIRFLAAGGRGLLWAPAGWSGELVGTGTRVEGNRGPSVPSLTLEGRSWLSTVGAASEPAPDGGRAWPSLEGLPAIALPVGEVTVLLAAGESPVAWLAERGSSRMAVALGTGYYRWPLETGSDEGPAPLFWREWSDAIVRWLASASPAIRPLVRMPFGRAIPASEPLRAVVPAGARDVRWRVERQGEEVAHGELAGDSARSLVAGPLPPGNYRLVIEASDGRRIGEPFVVEPWTPELAWTGADTAGLAAAARASGGSLVGDLGAEVVSALPVPSARAPEITSAGRPRLHLATWPWTFLAAALLVLADWALARPGPR